MPVRSPDHRPFAPLLLVPLLALALLTNFDAAAEEPPIKWLVTYDGNGTPSAPAWSAHGKPESEASDAGLRLTDSSPEDFGFFRAAWKPEPGTEVVVEATVKVGHTTGVSKSKPTSTSVWPWRDGAPLSVLVSDGVHQEGLVFLAERVMTWTDRFASTDTAGGFHTYRAVIRGTDMSVAVDGDVKIQGQNAFWKAAPSKDAFIQFGSTSKGARGEATWKAVRLGVRKATAPAAVTPVKITVSEPWPITRPDLKSKPTRPYVANIGEGRLLISVAEGPDAIHEPYGVLLSKDEGKTWTPLEGLDYTEIAPLPMLRLKDGSVLGMSRWTWPQENGTDVGFTAKMNPATWSHTLEPNRLHLPPEYRPQKTPFTCERHAFQDDDGSVVMAGYSKTGPSTPGGRRSSRRFSHLLRSTDGGKEWRHFAVVGAGGEPAIARTGQGKMTAILRMGPFRPLLQTFSEDAGRTWSSERELEVGSVCPDLVPMSNGLLACSYGRPAGGLMFSADGGQTWISHHVITDKTGFNYSAIVEIRPGRLLYLHDGGGLQGVYIDVERVKP